MTDLNPSEVVAWASALRTAALVGTGRRASAGAPSGFGTPPEDGEAFLDQAALFDVMSRAGARPVACVATAQAPPETRAYPPAEASRVLSLILRQPPLKGELRDELILTWLRVCGAHNLVVRPEALPELFEFARPKVKARQLLSDCWGERGRWFAANFDPKLLKVTVDSDEALGDTVAPGQIDDLVREWPTLDTPAAAIQLRRLRATDPDRGRELLSAHWSKLPAKARAEHLETLAATLSLGDEDLLESALEDRAKSVREVAVAMLAGLGGSRFRARMGERLAPLITVEKKLLRPTRIRLALPQGVDEAGTRDGLPAPDPSDANQPTAWLGAMIEAAPLDVWVKASGLKPRDIVEAFDSNSSDAHHFSEAIANSGDAEWADAIAPTTTNPRVVAVMSPAKREGWLLEHSAKTSESPHLFVSAIKATPQPWSREVSEAIVRRLGGAEDGDYFLYAFDAHLIAGLGPQSLAQARELLARPVKDPDKLAQARAKLLTIMQFQTFNQTIRDAFASAEEAQ